MESGSHRCTAMLVQVVHSPYRCGTTVAAQLQSNEIRKKVCNKIYAIMRRILKDASTKVAMALTSILEELKAIVSTPLFLRLVGLMIFTDRARP